MQQRDRETLRILQRHGTPPDGVTMLRADLGSLVADIARVGRDPALLLLTIRALRQRSGGRVVMGDLVWILRASKRFFAAFIHAPADEVVNHALDYVFSKDRDFQEYLKSAEAAAAAPSLRIRRVPQPAEQQERPARARKASV